MYGILIDRLADPIYNTTKINRNTDFRIVKIWGNYGKPLDDNILTESSLLKSDRKRKKVQNHISAYREWVANGAQEPRQKGTIQKNI